MLNEVYDEDFLSRARVFEWNKRFYSERENVKGDYCSGHPTTFSTNENIAKIDKIIWQNR